PDSRVRLQVQVQAGGLEPRVERTARRLGAELKLPGFRRGEGPAPPVIQRVGREAGREEAGRGGVPGRDSEGVEAAGTLPGCAPQLALGELPAEGEALEFAIEIGVLPTAQLGSYEGLKVARREPEIGAAEVEREVEAMRERLARLKTAERPAAKGDFLV